MRGKVLAAMLCFSCAGCLDGTGLRRPPPDPAPDAARVFPKLDAARSDFPFFGPPVDAAAPDARLVDAPAPDRIVDANLAPQQCEQFKRTYCYRWASCFPGASQVLCEQQLAVEIDCGRAIGVDEAYPRCIREVETFDCRVLFPATDGGVMATIPASCRGVIYLPDTGGGGAPG